MIKFLIVDDITDWLGSLEMVLSCTAVTTAIGISVVSVSSFRVSIHIYCLSGHLGHASRCRNFGLRLDIQSDFRIIGVLKM